MMRGKTSLISHQGRRFVILLGFFLTLILAAVFVVQPSLLHKLDHINYDFLLRNVPDNRISDHVVIVDLDEKSLSKYGQWPWPRYRVAELLQNVAAGKPAVVALDIVFAEPDRTSVKQILSDMADRHDIKLSLGRMPLTLEDHDQLLARILAQGPFILGNKFEFNPSSMSFKSCVLHPVAVAWLDSAAGHGTDIPRSLGVLCNLSILAEKVRSSGFINFSPDEDGMLRRLPLLTEYQDNVYPSLGLAAVLKYQKATSLLLRKKGRSLEKIQFLQTSVPVDRHGQMLIKFRGSQKTFDYLSAADIMDHVVSPSTLQNKIVFVGTSAAGLHDVLTTPFDSTFPGVEVHATIADNLLQRDFLSIPTWSHALVLGIILGVGVLLTLLIVFGRTSLGFTVTLFVMAALWLGTQQIFYRTGAFIATAYPTAAMVLLYLGLTVVKFRLEERQILANLRELILTQDITIESMASLAEYRDKETGGHIQRTRLYVKLLAEHLKHQEKFKQFLNDDHIDLLYKSAPLHDIGKVGIPDKILRKPTPLEKEEQEIMKTHTTIGYQVIDASIRKLGKKSFLFIAGEIAHCHHEKWDGTGYPRGLKEEAIPISARLMALADVYDALVSERIYKHPVAHGFAVDVIQKGRGTHFDPDVVDAFIEIHEQFRRVAENFADAPEGKSLVGERPFTES